MHHSDLVRICEATIESVQPGILSDDSLQKLRIIFPDTLILAALDLVDTQSVIQYVAPWGRTHYEVLGSTSTYTVFPISPTPYCNCPSFAYAVLMHQSQLMCKHVLATRLALRMSRCVVRKVSRDELTSIIVRTYAKISATGKTK